MIILSTYSAKLLCVSRSNESFPRAFPRSYYHSMSESINMIQVICYIYHWINISKNSFEFGQVFSNVDLTINIEQDA